MNLTLFSHAGHPQPRSTAGPCPELVPGLGRPTSPANGIRSDLRTQIQESLATSSFADIRAIEVISEGDQIVLAGLLDSYYHKQIAQQLVLFAYGQSCVVDHMKVATHGSGAPTG